MSIFNVGAARHTTSPPLFLSILSLLLVYSCVLVGQSSSNNGHIRSVQQGSTWQMEAPLGMVFVPGGVFKSGVFDQSLIQINERTTACSVDSFYIDQYPVVNAQYWEFIDDMLAKVGQGTAPNSQDLDGDFKQVSSPTTTPAPDTDTNELSQDYIMEVLYPDLSELRDIFGDAEADHYIKNYFAQGRSDGPYANFPVLGICHEAAQLFCEWRSKKLNAYRESQGLAPLPNFELPTAEQREYAARGGYQMAIYPWGGPYTRDGWGILLANFKTNASNYGECGYKFSSPVDAFPPNAYGLYDMAGNAREFIKHSSKDTPAVVETMGGSCLKIAWFMQPGVREKVRNSRYKPCDAGFRCVMPHIGEKPGS